MRLWYETPAAEWVQALPLGNGHMGAMAYGGADGLFDLSENTCWSGSAQRQYLVDNAADYMSRARSLLSKKKYDEANVLLARCCGLNENYGTQVPMGRLFAGISKQPAESTRELNLNTGLNRDRLLYDGCEITRESFISNPAQVMGVRIAAKGSVLPQLRVWLEGWSQPSRTWRQGNDLFVRGRALENIHSDGLTGVEYYMRLRIITDGELSWSRRGILIDGASSLVLYLAAATNFFHDDLDDRCKGRIEAAEKAAWQQVSEEHCAEHSAWMNRCSLVLSKNQSSDLPTDQRIRKYRSDQSDFDLIALFFQYGRYLLLNSSRPDSPLPAALQGVWNDNRACRMGWTDDMHLDINTQMNYYPAEATGLSECTAPLFKWLRNTLVPNGTRMARELYGSDGWVAHTVSNAHGWAAPGWHIGWAFFTSGGAWIAAHIWEHYLHTDDTAFLTANFDVLYGAGQFLKSILTEDPISGCLVTNPSYSPENAFLYQGKIQHVTTGATIDTIICKYIFQALINGAKILACEDDFILSLPQTINRLPDFKVGSAGQLLEWNEDLPEAMPDHRHTSHLLSLHPFNLISPERTPELANAARKTIQRRLAGHAEDIILANWAGALLIIYHARLLDAQSAADFIKPMISFLSRDNLMITHEGPTTSETGGIYELDGNTGFTTGITEMLMQSCSGEVHLLPAVPDAWATGAYTGLIAEKGHSIDVSWDSQRVSATVTAAIPGQIVLRYKEQRHVLEVQKAGQYHVTFEK